ncbi:MAG: polymer-forming cytoskeletal protein [Pseudomonadota bacterium]
MPKISAAGVAPSIVSANLRVTGDLESEGDIQIDGHVEGDVRSNSVTVGEHAVVCGAIVSHKVHVAGTVKGQINGKMVELTRTAKVTGDIMHESLAIEAGAFIQGLCRHADNPVQDGRDAAEANGRAKPAKKVTAEAAPASNGNGAATAEDDKAAKSAIAATAAKGQEAVKKAFS